MYNVHSLMNVLIEHYSIDKLKLKLEIIWKELFLVKQINMYLNEIFSFKDHSLKTRIQPQQQWTKDRTI